MEPDGTLVSLLSGVTGAAGTAWLLRRALFGEVTEIVTKAIEKERTLLAERFATREQAARIEGKIDALLARAAGAK